MPESEPSFRTERINPADLDRLVGLLDLQAALPGIQRLRQWALLALDLHPGEKALDVGAGTGEDVQAFAAAVGSAGDAVGVEPNAGMRAVAEERAREKASVARFVDGDAYALPFGDNTFDAVRCERVFQHLAEPERAAAEIARVLRPGGRAVVIDSDWATAILHPGDPSVLDALTTAMLATTPNPYSGRRLAGQLTAAGLKVTDIGSQALIQDNTAADGSLVRMLAATGVGRGAITQEQADKFLADLAAGAQSGDFHMSVTMFAVLAHKG
ncbi:Methyltransferase domain-containing protein [Actinokineospora alba]|uniref:Methyltransferase domain-containing protein n=1 Tax=Actinokineospora alba TaxID=504798 RepID=A0A1H0WH41_9PSEU|nr:methyltransferase domain-containing protein [Actinokineospora alba]TDP65321.1 methyltransferase family protein [Actinokineospora alba]SDH59675.1 Methyltransferase domain-containing protein [Actinokineospora alba]SDP89795.1 Methyltransferase domain-containing protein [Actinokineospora alba]